MSVTLSAGELHQAPPRHSHTPAQVGAVLLAAVVVVWAYAAPGYWVFTANVGVILAITALGLMIVVGGAREVSLVHAGLTGTAVYVSAWAYRSGDGLGLPYLVAGALGIVVVVGLSVLISLATARLSGIYILVLTLALQITLERTVFTYPSMTGAGLASPRIDRPSFLGVKLDSDRSFYFFSILVLIALLVSLARLRVSRFGRGLLLVGTDRQAAAAVGVSPWGAKIFAFALAGMCAGIAGMLTAPLYTTPPSFIAYTSFVSLLYLAIPVLAGFRSLMAVVIVAISFQMVPQALEWLHISPFALGAAGLLLGTLTGPGGIGGLVLDRMQAIRRARAGTFVPVDLRSWREQARGEEPVGKELERAQALNVLREYLPHQATKGDVLVARDVAVAFGGVRALRGVTINVPAGHLVGLIGPNGAGKTTLFDVINGLRVPDAGQVLFDDRDITPTRAWQRADLGLSRTFQASRLTLELSVADNLLAGAYTMIPGGPVGSIVGRRGPRDGMRRAEEAAWAVAQLFRIDHYWDEPVRMLSFGNRRRVEIGRSLMSGPRVLLFDEPSAGLDPTAARTLFSLVKQLHRELGLTVVLVEHYVRAVLEHCDLIYVLAQGEVVAVGTPADVANHPDVRSEYLGPDFDPAKLTLASSGGEEWARPR